MMMEGVELTDATLATIEYLQHVYELLEAGQEERILSDPFFVRPNGKPPFTDEDVDRIIAAIDEEFEEEMGKYPGYHRNRSGANYIPEFHRLSPSARRAVVEGLDALLYTVPSSLADSVEYDNSGYNEWYGD